MIPSGVAREGEFGKAKSEKTHYAPPEADTRNYPSLTEGITSPCVLKQSEHFHQIIAGSQFQRSKSKAHSLLRP